MEEEQLPGSPDILNTHKVKIQDNNGGSRVDIPQEVAKTVGIEPGDIGKIRANEGKYGRYVELWIPEKQGEKGGDD